MMLQTGLPNRAKPKIVLFFLPNHFVLKTVWQTILRISTDLSLKMVLFLRAKPFRVCKTISSLNWFCKKKQYNLRFCTVWQTSLQHQTGLTPKKSSINSGLTAKHNQNGFKQTGFSTISQLFFLGFEQNQFCSKTISTARPNWFVPKKSSTNSGLAAPISTRSLPNQSQG